MADNLVLEHLHALRADVSHVKETLRDHTARLTLIGDQVAALVRHENYTMTKFAELENRVERIERRLDLVD